MEIKLIWIIGPLLATLAMFAVGKNMVNRDKGKSINVGPASALMISAILFHLLFGEASLLDRLSLMMMDFGIGMLIDSRYLAYHKVHPKVFFGLGMLSLVIAGILYGLSSVFDITISKYEASKAAHVQEIILELGPDDSISELEGTFGIFEAQWEKAFPKMNMKMDEDLAQMYLVRIPKSKTQDFLAVMRKDGENVDNVAINSIVTIPEPIQKSDLSVSKSGLNLNDPLAGNQWWMDAERHNKIFDYLKSHKPKKKARVAILDTGVKSDHEDLEAVLVNSPGLTDEQGHGTHCAGLAGAATDNGIGIASLNYKGNFIEILSFKALDEDGAGTIETVAQGILDATNSGVDVINLSLGSYAIIPPFVLVEAISYAQEMGVIVVAASGNSDMDASTHSPANIDGVIAVSASNQTQNKAPFSNTNNTLKMPISAPGVDMLSSYMDGEYRPLSGTSMAAPLVSGLCGILRSLNPALSGDDVYKILHDTGIEGPDSKIIGRTIDPLRAIEAL